MKVFIILLVLFTNIALSQTTDYRIPSGHSLDPNTGGRLGDPIYTGWLNIDYYYNVDTGNDTVDCSGDGDNCCAIADSDLDGRDYTSVHVNDMRDYAAQEIQNGVTSGSYVSNFSYNGKNFYRNVVWNSSVGSTSLQVNINAVNP